MILKVRVAVVWSCSFTLLLLLVLLFALSWRQTAGVMWTVCSMPVRLQKAIPLLVRLPSACCHTTTGLCTESSFKLADAATPIIHRYCVHTLTCSNILDTYTYPSTSKKKRVEQRRGKVRAGKRRRKEQDQEKGNGKRR